MTHINAYSHTNTYSLTHKVKAFVPAKDVDKSRCTCFTHQMANKSGELATYLREKKITESINALTQIAVMLNFVMIKRKMLCCDMFVLKGCWFISHDNMFICSLRFSLISLQGCLLCGQDKHVSTPFGVFRTHCFIFCVNEFILELYEKERYLQHQRLCCCWFRCLEIVMGLAARFFCFHQHFLLYKGWIVLCYG